MNGRVLTLLQDVQLERVLELWVATHILVDTELRWKTFSNPTLPPTSINALAPSSDEGRLPIDDITNPESYALLCSQLRAATEKRTAQLSKSIMNDLERRLLQRQQSGYFETFLVALILLNCVERTCWLFRTWDDEKYAKRVSTSQLQCLPPEHRALIFFASGLSRNALPTMQTKVTASRMFSICC